MTNTPTTKTVVIHECDALNDITVDAGWEMISVVVALNHETWEVVGADVSCRALAARMSAQGYRVLHEDDEFDQIDDKWLRNATEVRDVI